MGAVRRPRSMKLTYLERFVHVRSSYRGISTSLSIHAARTTSGAVPNALSLEGSDLFRSNAFVKDDVLT